MSNVVGIKTNCITGYSDAFQYVRNLDDDLVGITTGGLSISISKLLKGSVDVEITPVLGYSRHQVAQFLWAAAVFFDSEERYRQSGEMAAMDYDI